jgi:hypothetical protein
MLTQRMHVCHWQSLQLHSVLCTRLACVSWLLHMLSLGMMSYYL